MGDVVGALAERQNEDQIEHQLYRRYTLLTRPSGRVVILRAVGHRSASPVARRRIRGHRENTLLGLGYRRDALEYLTTPDNVWDRARGVQHALAADGLHRTVKIPDLIISAVAEHHGVSVIHYDRDFDRIAAVTGQPVEWVVPAGSV